MERKIGEIFELNGKKYQVIEDYKLDLDCKECGFKDEKCWLFNTGVCLGCLRKDKKDVCFKLVEDK